MQYTTYLKEYSFSQTIERLEMDLQRDMYSVRKIDDFRSQSLKEIISVDESTLERSRHKSANWFHWFEPGTTTRDKKLILKLQFFILSFSMCSYFLKYLDQTNISNAYVSGMKEDLNLTSNQLSWFNTYFNIGTIIGSIPAVFLASHFRPRYFLPLMDLLWSLSVLFIYKCKTANGIYACRFFLGLFESATNPFGHIMLGSWFKSSEILRLANFYISAGVIGQATSSYIQVGLQSSVDGKLGLRAYQWLFIFEACLGLPVIIYGLIFLPDFPYNTKAFYLDDWERKRAIERLREDDKVVEEIKFSMESAKIILFSWQTYIFLVAYCFWTLTACSYMLQFFELYLKNEKYSLSYVNNFPTIISGVNLATMLLSGYICDKLGKRWPVTVFIGAILIVSTVILATTTSVHARKAGYIMTGVYGCFTPILSGWCNISCKKTPVLRAFIIPAMIVAGQIVVTPYQQNVFPSNDAPFYRTTNGMWYAVGFCIALTLWTSLLMPICDKFIGEKQGKYRIKPLMFRSKSGMSGDAL